MDAEDFIKKALIVHAIIFGVCLVIIGIVELGLYLDI